MRCGKAYIASLIIASTAGCAVFSMTGALLPAVTACAGSLMCILILFLFCRPARGAKAGGGGACVIWLTGLPASGKSTLAERLCRKFRGMGLPVEHLDGDGVRALFPGTGFSREERDGHVRRTGYAAMLLERQGVTVVCSFVSPYRETREWVRSICDNFIEVYVKAPVAACERRDRKGLYRRARAGEIKNFTGIDDPYEAPDHPELVIDTETLNEEESFKTLAAFLFQNGIFGKN